MFHRTVQRFLAETSDRQKTTARCVITTICGVLHKQSIKKPERKNASGFFVLHRTFEKLLRYQ
jgi:hypothetical protein